MVRLALAILLLLTISSSAIAANDPPTNFQCFELEKILNDLFKEGFKVTAKFRISQSESEILVDEEGNWIQLVIPEYQPTTACFLAGGDNFILIGSRGI